MNRPRQHRRPAGWQPAAGSRLPRPRVTGDLIATLTARLTPRDRWLLHALHEYRVLTSTHIGQMLFGSQRATNARLHTLHQLRAVDRFRPLTPIGSAPWHYVLDDAGAAVLAAATGVTLAELGHRRDRALALAHSPRLAHLTGVNTLFTSLIAHARQHPGLRLALWWPEHRCRTVWGDLARPDAYGRWQHQHTNPRTSIHRSPHTSIDFFLEHDTGTEPLNRVADKLNGYADLADATGITTPVLINLPSPRREAHLRQLLTHPPVPVATTNTSEYPNPAIEVWLPPGADADAPRVSLLDLDADLGADLAAGAPHTSLPAAASTDPIQPEPIPTNAPLGAPIGLAAAWDLPTALPDLPAPARAGTPNGGHRR
ncbi:MAG: replication-relaxation family protein [Mycobacteriales bacterium]